ncbi:BRCT domain-containing protein [Streptococcus vestibularis]|uniref:BRCT domain-containing protein n=1 Tax=Streptococcus vestibularis TaxID=1343 RepID=UPI0026DFF71B|nr:BRCT domain-containing protein [Streptococcus vestibularis]
MEWKDKIVVITGSLRPLTRTQVIAYLESQGAIVQSFVSNQTQVLIAGHKQLDLFDPDKRSQKYQAALSRQADGQALEIVSEDAFFEAVKETG